MKLYLCRHGQAVSQAATDALRPLTEAGQAALLSHWQSLQGRGVQVSGLIVSPYLRAQQTADCIAQVYSGLSRQECPYLTPDSHPQALFDWLLANPPASNMVLVSHMPLVSQLTAKWTGVPERVGFNVGTVACFDVDVTAANGAQLLWLCSPGEELASR
ncbi:histidine phosphatase [Alcanivorax sp. HI0083]|uniref:phosphohistidine phosphatase SixA n=1 Tax=unclassified Alcanivorax TaxID=2638842 RepID=UPI0007B8867B|nr:MULTISPECIES: phosphohistidine phosphatase SixA [unclassified Alcanivorax]KZY30083.1 histidine phosphatase [Alcanivorax sp. HI0044]KZZ30126.1 histidine phosphatase [Alcanivorax sp. HI0083]